MVVRAMSRTYLSIGDVLSLLREEFPDVTISKIRFLESQGLVDPERSPSGYRKFYDGDVARLRWVLRKQRDQFLPLKVIRDRLAAAGTGVPPDDEPVGNGEPAWRQDEGATAVPRALGEGAPAVAGAVAGAGAQARNGAAERYPLEDDDDSGSRGAGEPVVAVGGSASAPADAAPGSGFRAVAPQRAATAVAERGVGASPGERRPPAESEEVRAAQRPGCAPVGADEPVAAQQPGAEEPPARPSVASVASGAPGRESAVVSSTGAGEVLSPSVSGVSLTLPELCAATGLTPPLVASLEGLGLLASMPVAGGTYYDEEALTVGKLAVEFARYGIEPRHLKMYRNAVDREVGLVEQVIMPLLRQRNPEARRRAVDAAAELTRLGQSMRASLVRSELRRQLGT